MNPRKLGPESLPCAACPHLLCAPRSHQGFWCQEGPRGARTRLDTTSRDGRSVKSRDLLSLPGRRRRGAPACPRPPWVLAVRCRQRGQGGLTPGRGGAGRWRCSHPKALVPNERLCWGSGPGAGCPWGEREGRSSSPDPLGAQSGNCVLPISPYTGQVSDGGKPAGPQVPPTSWPPH